MDEDGLQSAEPPGLAHVEKAGLNPQQHDEIVETPPQESAKPRPFPVNLTGFYNMDDAPWVPLNAQSFTPLLSNVSSPGGGSFFQQYRNKPVLSECDTLPDDSGYGTTLHFFSPSVYEDRPSPAVQVAKQHGLRHNKPYRCDFPGCAPKDGFSTINDLDRHEKVIHSIVTVPAVRYSCPFGSCGAAKNPRLWLRGDNFRSHLRRIHHTSYSSDDELSGFVYHTPHESLINPSISQQRVTSGRAPSPLQNTELFPSFLSLDSSHTSMENEQEKMPPPQIKLPKVVPTPFTDSGYASISNIDPVCDSIADDRGTICSAAATPTFAQQIILDICNHIHSKIKTHGGNGNWTSMSHVVSRLVKSFAIKLGTIKSTNRSRQIMHFTYQNHKKIALQLQKMFQGIDYEASESRPTTSGGMSLHDKMGLWGLKLAESQTKPDESELFEGVVDDENDDIGHPELLAYEEEIFSSTACDWLVDSFLKHSRFYWGNTQPRIMIDEISQRILSQLATGRISRHKDPITYGVTFWLPWEPIAQRITTERRNLLSKPISECIVSTGSSANQVQVSTIEGYFQQTWPSNGMDLLVAVQQVIDGLSGTITSVSQVDKTNIRTTISGSVLVVHVIGSPHSIAECGEQLAWLGAALQPSHFGFSTYISPSLTEISKARPNRSAKNMSIALDQVQTNLYRPGTILRDGTFWEDLPCHHHWAINLQSSNQSQSLSLKQCLDGISAQSVIVQGYPTLNRPRFHAGIEVSTRIIFDMTKSTVLTFDAGKLAVRGPIYHIGLVKERDDVFVWHIFRSPDYTCACQLTTLSDHDIEGLRGIDLLKLWQYRHIIEPCQNSQCYDDKELSGTNLAQANTPPSASAKLSDSPSPQSITKMESIDASVDSMDSDMLSIPDSSEGASLRSWSHSPELDPVINEATAQLLAAYRRSTSQRIAIDNTTSVLSEAPNDVDVSTSTSDDPMSTTTTLNPSTQNNTSTSLKRQRDENDDEDGAEKDGSKMPPTKIPTGNKRKLPSKLFACPFWKHDPMKHKKCFGKQLPETKRVKQHLTRTHTPRYYCQRCLDVFTDEESHGLHISQVTSCNYDASKTLNGISYLQSRSLSQKSNRNHSEPEKWFQIWDILFPGLERPSSAYINEDISEDMCSYREFSERHGASIVLQAIEASPVSFLPNKDLASILQKAINRGLTGIHNEWLSRRTSSDPITILNPSHQLPARYAATGSSVGDSGIADSQSGGILNDVNQEAQSSVSYISAGNPTPEQETIVQGTQSISHSYQGQLDDNFAQGINNEGVGFNIFGGTWNTTYNEDDLDALLNMQETSVQN